MTENSIEGVRERIDRVDDPLAHVQGRIDADVDPPSAELGTLEHDEWALDEVLEEPFPRAIRRPLRVQEVRWRSAMQFAPPFGFGDREPFDGS